MESSSALIRISAAPVLEVVICMMLLFTVEEPVSVNE